VHLLPSFDFASVNEDKSTWKVVGELPLRWTPALGSLHPSLQQPKRWAPEPGFALPGGSGATSCAAAVCAAP